jgi:hypothetical protein
MNTEPELTLDEKLELGEQYYNEGMSLRKIGRLLHFNRGRLLSVHLKKKGYIIPARVGNSDYDREELFKQMEIIWVETKCSIKKLCREYHTTPVSFTTYLRKKGHTVNPHRNPGNHELRIRKLKEAEKLYLEGATIAEAARIVKVNNAALSDYLKSKNHNTYQNCQIRIGNDRAFHIIDNEEKAYWLGFLYADANIVHDGIRYGLDLCLQKADKDHLIKFKQFLDTDSEIKNKFIKGMDGKKYEAVRIYVSKKILVEDLINKGCFPNKSLTLKFPSYDIVPKHLMPHFIRGYFEGDGSIYLPLIGSKGSPQAQISFIGTIDFLLGIRKEINTTQTKMLPEGKAFRSSHSGNKKVNKYLDTLYADSTIYLDRKYKQYLKFKRLYKPWL